MVLTWGGGDGEGEKVWIGVRVRVGRGSEGEALDWVATCWCVRAMCCLGEGEEGAM